MMKDRILWIIFALIGFALLIPIGFSFNGEWEVYNKGKLVLATIISLPNEHSPTNFMKFEMNNHIYDKRVNESVYSSLHVGDKIQLKYLKGYEDFFLFSDENPLFWGICGILFFSILGCCCLYYGLKKTPVPFRLPFTSKRSSNR